MTNVMNLNTGLFTLYTLSPFDSVVAAYAQHEKQNFNTWTYDQYHSLVVSFGSIKSGISVITCGNQSALYRTNHENFYARPDYEPVQWSVEQELEAQAWGIKLRDDMLRRYNEGLSPE